MPPILMEIDEIIKNARKKLKEVEDHPTYSEEQRQSYIEMKTEKQARLKNHKIEKIFKHKLQGSNRPLKKESLEGRICVLFCEQGIATIAIITALPITISAIGITITVVFGE